MSTTAQVPTTVTLTLTEEERAAAAESLTQAIEVAGPNPDADRAFEAITSAEGDDVTLDLSAAETLGTGILVITFSGLFATDQQVALLEAIQNALRPIVEEHGEEAYAAVADAQREYVSPSEESEDGR